MTDTEKLQLIDHVIADFFEYNAEDVASCNTLINCISFIISFSPNEGGKNGKT